MAEQKTEVAKHIQAMTPEERDALTPEQRWDYTLEEGDELLARLVQKDMTVLTQVREMAHTLYHSAETVGVDPLSREFQAGLLAVACELQMQGERNHYLLHAGDAFLCAVVTLRRNGKDVCPENYEPNPGVYL